jgi:hypothetical protein
MLFHRVLLLGFASFSLAHGEVTGPDPYGYLLDDDREFNWIEISTTGQLVVGAGNDISSNHPTVGIGSPVSLGHPFTLYGVTYHQLVPTSNGYLSGNPAETGSDATNDCPFPVTPSHGSGARILAFHDDLVIPATGGAGVFYQYFDISPHPHARCGVSVFTWKNVTFSGGTSAFSFQALLFDTGDIIVNYDNAGLILGASATVGIMHSDVHTALKWFCSEFKINSDRAILYEPPSLTVGSTADENRPNPPANAMSLREVIRDLPTGGKIYLPNSTAVFTFTSNLVVNRSMSLVGDFPDSPNPFFTTPNFGGPSFTVENGAVLNFDNIPLSDTTTDTITARGNATVKLANCSIAGAQGNSIKILGGAHVTLAATSIDAPGASSADVIGITDGTLRMFRSLIDGGHGLGIGIKHPAGYTPPRPSLDLDHSSIIRNGTGGISGNGEIQINTSTISDNAGPGISLTGAADLVVTQSSIMDNRTGVIVDGTSTAHFTRSVISRNVGIGTATPSDLLLKSGSALSGGWNIAGNSHGVFTAGNDIITANPHFTPVGPYASVETDRIGPRRGYNHLYCHMPLAASPAIDGGGLPSSPGGPFDIRGLPRVANGDNIGGAIIDIGPVESPPFITVTTAIDEDNGPTAGAGLSLRECNDILDPQVTIRFAPALDGQSILTSPSDGGQGTPVTLGTYRFVDASMLPNGITIDAGEEDPEFDWTLAFGNYLHGITFRRGKYKAINTSQVLILSDCHFENNRSRGFQIPEALNGGGAIYSNDLLHATNCTFIGNVAQSTSASAGGGAIHLRTITPSGSVETRGYGYLIGCHFENNSCTTFGGALWAHPATRRVWIDRCEFTDNGGGIGGAAYISGGNQPYRTRGSVLRSTFSENSGGQDFPRGALFLGPPVGITMPVRHCTFDRNITGWKGGAISNAFSAGIVDISHSTFTRNFAGVGGASIHCNTGTIRLSHSLIDDNTLGNDGSQLPDTEKAIHVENGGTFQTLGNNLTGEAVPLLNHATDLTLTEPHLTELLDHGGPTRSRHPFANSPAIDSGAIASSHVIDQRGFPARSGTRVDRGAVEAMPMIITTSADELNNPAGTHRSLREALRDAVPGQHLVFDDGAMASHFINLETGLNTVLTINKSLLIDATTTTQGITVSGPSAARCVNIENGERTVQFHGVSFTLGRASLNGGAIRKGAGATLHMSRSAIYENTAAAGGGILALEGDATFTNVTFSDNEALSGSGGGILAETGARLSLAHCTFRGNDSTAGGAQIDLNADASLTTLLTAFAENGSFNQVRPSFDVLPTAAVISQGGNLFTDGPYPWSNGTDLTGPSGLLGAFDFYGGLARTALPSSGSILLDAASPSLPGIPLTDTRGLPRVYGSGLDIGAAELNAVDYGLNVDTDGDGMPDDWEIANGLNLTDPSDAAEDSDADGQNNLAEYSAGTDPADPSSVFRILSILRHPTGTQLTLTWSSVAGRTYQVRRSNSLQADWQPAGSIVATGPTTSLVLTGIHVPAGSHFYRIEVSAP